MQVIPFTADPAQSFNVTLGTARVTIDARFSDYSQSWTFDLTLADTQTLVLTNVPVLIGQDLLSSYPLGLGGLVAADLSGAGIDAGPDDFGDRVQVSWFSPAELAVLVAAGAVL